MLRLKFVFIIVLLGIASLCSAQTNKKSNKLFADSLRNKNKWLKIEIVVCIQSGILENSDVTRVTDSGVYYMRGEDTAFRKVTRYYSADDFVNDYRSRAGNFQVFRWPIGLAVQIYRISQKKENWEIGIVSPAGSKSAVFLDFRKSNYDMNDIRRLLSIAFADSAK